MAQPVEHVQAAPKRQGRLRAVQVEHVGQAARRPGVDVAVRRGVGLGQAGERARSSAHVRGRPGQSLQCPDQVNVRRRRAERHPQLAVEEERAQQRRITAEADVDGIEEGIRRSLGEQRKDVGEGLPGAPGGIGVSVFGDSTDHALGMLLAGGPVVERLLGHVSTEERHRVRDARPQPGRVNPRLADDGGHEPALSGDIERGIVLLEDYGPRPRGTGPGWSW